MEIFVPGRLCLVGEHSDWASSYANSSCDGYAIIVGTEQGVYARVSFEEMCADKQLKMIHVTTEMEVKERLFNLSNIQELIEEASSNSWWGYCAGTAAYIASNYSLPDHTRLLINNYKTDLPVKKGWSSSAAICVLIAKSFNEAYGFHWTTQEIMNIAYHGERMTPSQCGRLDQGCAYGRMAIRMKFTRNGEVVVDPLKVTGKFHFVIVDLNGQKDTRKILSDLNSCFNSDNNKISDGLKRALGPMNADVVDRMSSALIGGRPVVAGSIMTQAQSIFDELVAPISSELRAPLLHGLLSNPSISKHVYGGKGVGSQGDGAAQFLCKSETDQELLINLLKTQYPQMTSFKLTLS